MDGRSLRTTKEPVISRKVQNIRIDTAVWEGLKPVAEAKGMSRNAMFEELARQAIEEFNATSDEVA